MRLGFKPSRGVDRSLVGSTPAAFRHSCFRRRCRHGHARAVPAPSTADAPQRLTSLAHGGGCGCKIAPGVLTELLRGAPALPAPAELLVGRETSDDAAVYRLDDHQAIVATTDFFMPIVDDPFDFGRIAATNALSDLYAMGARPLFALAIVGMPINTLPQDTIRSILQGGERACADAGIVVAGGHSIDSVEPIYGLAAIGMLDPQRLKRNADARAGDVLVLGKPLGVGVYSSALKKKCWMPTATSRCSSRPPDLTPWASRWPHWTACTR